MKKETFAEIQNKKLLNRLRNGLEKKKALRARLKDIKSALLFLNGIASIIPCLLRPLFVKEDSSSSEDK